MTQLNDTIALLSKDIHMPRSARYFSRVYISLTLFSIMVVAGLTFMASLYQWLSFRPDYWNNLIQISTTPHVSLKQLIPAFIGVIILFNIRALAYPETDRGRWHHILSLAPIFIFPILFVLALYNMELSQWRDVIIGGSLARCVVLIPSLALVILAAQITALIHSAPQHPIWLGIRAGIIAGAWATMIYAFFCTEDSPAFYGLWYSVGIMITGGIGALAGRIFLRW